MGFLSKKFSSAQQNYRTHEHETIAILKALIKWEDKLLGQKFVVVTDHKSCKYFETQPHLSSRQTRWWEYISHFKFTIQHVDGTDNQVADCLSHYCEADGPEDHHPDHDFVSADVKLNPDGELLPIQCYIKLHSAVAGRSCCLAEQTEQHVLDSIRLNVESSPIPMGPDDDNSPLAIRAGANGQSLHTHVEWQVDLARIVGKHYRKDLVFAKILVHPDAHQQFGVCDDLIWTKIQMGRDIVCLPRKAFLRDRRLVEIIINQAHTMIGHFGQSATSRYIWRYY